MTKQSKLGGAIFWGLVVIAGGNLLSPVRASASDASMEGSHSAFSQGRALFTAEDMRALLGLEARLPSSLDGVTPPKEQEAPGAWNPMDLSLSPPQRQELERRIRAVENNRVRLEAQTSKKAQTQTAALKVERQNIQGARITADSAALGKQLFNNVLKQANVEASAARELADFDRHNAFIIEFQVSPVTGVRTAQSIMLGQHVVWTAGGSGKIARK